MSSDSVLAPSTSISGASAPFTFISRPSAIGLQQEQVWKEMEERKEGSSAEAGVQVTLVSQAGTHALFISKAKESEAARGVDIEWSPLELKANLNALKKLYRHEHPELKVKRRKQPAAHLSATAAADGNAMPGSEPDPSPVANEEMELAVLRRRIEELEKELPVHRVAECSSTSGSASRSGATSKRAPKLKQPTKRAREQGTGPDDVTAAQESRPRPTMSSSSMMQDVVDSKESGSLQESDIVDDPFQPAAAIDRESAKQAHVALQVERPWANAIVAVVEAQPEELSSPINLNRQQSDPIQAEPAAAAAADEANQSRSDEDNLEYLRRKLVEAQEIKFRGPGMPRRCMSHQCILRAYKIEYFRQMHRQKAAPHAAK